MSETKVCNECQFEKDLTFFELTGYGYPRNTCGACRQKKKRPQRLAKIYGVPFQELLILKENQDYKCAICGVNDHDTTKGLAIDHDHQTGKVRGWLCHNCNRAIGMLRDDPNVLRKAVEYLEKE
jgi:hypothetical protein